MPSGGNAVNITEDVRNYAAEQAISEEKPSPKAWQRRAKSLWKLEPRSIRPARHSD
jgi:hypothetical protein